MDFEASLNCSGKVNSNVWLLSKRSLILRGEVENVLFPQEEYFLVDVDVKLFTCAMPAATAILNFKHFVKCTEMQLKILSRHENFNRVFNSSNKDNTDFFSVRNTISQFILYFRAYMNSIHWNMHSLRILNPEIDEDLDRLYVSIKRFFGRLRDIPESTFHYAVSNLGNKCTQPEFHMYHMHLELRWFFMTLTYASNMSWQYSMDNQDEFENIQKLIINDLIYISLKIFERIPLADLKQRTPYSCTCLRELWLMLQIFFDSIAERRKSKMFWDLVNNCIDPLLNKTIAGANVIYWYNNSAGYHLPDCKNPELFCIWLIHHLSLLYGYTMGGAYLETNSTRIKPNYEEIEKILKTYIYKGGKDGERDEIDEELRVMIPLLSLLITEWWEPRVSVVSLLWDCFHKRLNQPFLLQTSGPWTVSVEKKTAMDIFKRIKDRIGNTFEQQKESSYGMFLRLTGIFLRKNYKPNDVKYWNQIKGRVYSKFSKSKVQEFSETGLYHFISLFLTLAVTADTTNVCSVMLDLLPPVHEFNHENSRKYTLIWKGKLAVLLLYNELKLNFENVATTFLDTVNAISCRKDETSRSLMIHFVDTLNVILSSSTKMEYGEHLFIGGWIDRYLLECPKNKIGILLRALIEILEKCISAKTLSDRSESIDKMTNALWSYVACRVRQLVFDPILVSDHYRDVAKLAVIFTLEALRDPATAKKHRHSAVSLFQHFAASVIVKDIRITRYYLVLIVREDRASQNLRREIKNYDLILIQGWIKSSILGFDANKNEAKILQNYVSHLDEIRQIFLTDRDFNEFQNSEESILIFIMSCVKRRNVLKTDHERMQYDAKCRLYLNNVDKWILSSITEETKESEVAFWIYRCIGTLILCLSSVLYVKNQRNNMLRLLINKVALPSEPSQQYRKSLGKRIFSMVLLGIENLNVKADISLHALIRDLFDQYMPLLITEIDDSKNFKVSDVLLKCFTDAKVDFLRLMFETLMANFVIMSNDNTMHKHSYLVILLLKHLLKGGKRYARHVVELIVNICTTHIIGCYMKVHNLHPHKQHAIEFISDTIRNPYCNEDISIRKKLYDIICNAVYKYLIAYPQSTFELIRSISSVKADVLKVVSPQVENILVELERNRRPNATSLRYSWSQLKNLVDNTGER